MNVLQIAPDGTRERRVIEDGWAHGYRVPILPKMSLAVGRPDDDVSRAVVKTLDYRNTGLQTDGHLTVFVTDAHQLDVARIEMSFMSREPRTSSETHLRNEMIEFIQNAGIDRKDILAERIYDIPNPRLEPLDLMYSLRMEWVTLKSRS